MEFTEVSSLSVPPLIGALLRQPAQAIFHRLIAALNEAGFEELRLPHMAVFQYPGPDGFRPSELAERANMSKQAMNQLLQSLEKWGYVYRAGAKDGGRAVVVYSTRRGDAVWQKMLEILVEIEDQWRQELGQERFAQLKELLSEVWLSPLVQADLGRPAT